MRLYKIPLNLPFSNFITGYNISLIAAAVGIVWFRMLMSNMYIKKDIKLYGLSIEEVVLVWKHSLRTLKLCNYLNRIKI